MICDRMARNKSIANEFEHLPSLQRFLLELPDDIDRIEALLNCITYTKTNICFVVTAQIIIRVVDYREYCCIYLYCSVPKFIESFNIEFEYDSHYS